MKTKITTDITMTPKSSRISEEIYRRLLNLTSNFHIKEIISISIADARTHLLNSRIGDLAGTWELDQDEADDILKSMKMVW